MRLLANEREVRGRANFCWTGPESGAASRTGYLERGFKALGRIIALGMLEDNLRSAAFIA